MNRFAALIDALLFTPGRNGKLRLMQEYFRATPDPERGWALAALTGELSFAEAKPSQVRDLAISRVDPELFGWSYDFVGDLAETVSLIWPERPGANRVPELSEIVDGLASAHRASVGALLERWLDALDATGRDGPRPRRGSRCLASRRSPSGGEYPRPQAGEDWGGGWVRAK